MCTRVMGNEFQYSRYQLYDCPSQLLGCVAETVQDNKSEGLWINGDTHANTCWTIREVR